MTLQDACNRLVGDVMAEIGQGTSDPIVSPAGVLLGHTDDERFHGRVDTRSSRIGTMLGAVELAGNEPAIPSQDGLWFGDQGHVRQIFPAETLADLS